MAIKELFNDNRPQVLFDPRASQRIDPRFKFTRNGTATYVDRDGLIKIAGVNQPRFDYDPETLNERGLLLERTSTNRFSNSIPFANWENNTLTVVNNTTETTAPDGSSTATKVSSGSGDNSIRVRIGGPVEQQTFSLFCKAAPGGRYFGFSLVGGATPLPDGLAASWYIGIDFQTEQLFRIKVNGSSFAYLTSPSYASLTKHPNGWYRISWTYNQSSGVAGGTFIGIDYDALGSITFGPTYVWGQQREPGDLSSYIPTSGSSVTRAADLLSVEAPLPTSGSVYIDARAITTPENGALISLKNDSDDKIDLAYLSNAATFNSLALVGNYDGTTKTSLPLPVPTTNRERNILTWGANNYQYTKDSSRFAPSLSSSVPTGLNKLSIGHDAVDPTKAFNGYINTIYAWSGELTPTVAEALVRNDLEPINADTFSPVGPAGSLSLVINTQGASSTGEKTFTLPAESAANDNDLVITWGDGTESGLEGAAAELGAAGLAHTYPAAGIYPVYVEGKLQNLFFNNSADAKDLLEISAWGTTTGGNNVFLAPSTMNGAFYGCSKLQSIPSTNLPDTSAVADWTNAFRDCSSLTGTFRSFNFSAATTFQGAFYNCSGITSFTAAGDQTQNVTNFTNAWLGCSGLTSFPLINTAAGTNFNAAWYGCSGLTSFPLINTAAGTFFGNAWTGCTGLTSFPLINTAAGTNFGNAWRGCSGLTSFPLINTAAGTNFNGAWFGCSGLTSFPLINTAAGTNFGSAWLGCSGLTSFPLINTAAGTNFSAAWNDCSGLTSFPLINTAAGTNFSIAWRNNDGLTAFPALDFDSATGLASDASNTYTGFRETWFSCGALTAFPPNLFDNTTCTRYLDAFRDCALTAASIENIIVSINAAGTSNGNLSLQGGTNAGASTWTANAVTAYVALVARGWTITRNA